MELIMKVLLIWDSCGVDPIKLYEVTGDSVNIVIASANQYVNSSDLADDAPIYDLNNLLYGSNGELMRPDDFHELTNTLQPLAYDGIIICGSLP